MYTYNHTGWRIENVGGEMEFGKWEKTELWKMEIHIDRQVHPLDIQSIYAIWNTNNTFH